ncbi:MAG TPA: copper resistance CopC family protein [Roseiarcus sp.]|nr:copper resistance CopC family protein [Roseiarcus sp.]
MLLALFATTLAHAHAHLAHATPAASSVVHNMPESVELSFSEAVEPVFSSIEVVDSTGGHLEEGKPTPDARDTKILKIEIKLTEPGVYKVLWRVLSVDTHRSSGDFTFTVAP